MRYVDLVLQRPLVWALFLVFMVATSWLAWLGHKKTTDIKSYSVGSGAMNPLIVGVTLASSIASTATFVINPGFVYVHGFSALIHFGVAAGLGIALGLVVLSTGFRRIGAKTKALTLPQWIGQRFESRGLGVLFAGINLLSLSFVVLICGGISIVMQQVLGLTNTEALVLTISFVFGYIMIGGTYAHAYTNTLQGIIMVAVAVIILVSGLGVLSGGIGPFVAAVEAQDPNLMLTVNPKSNLFGSFFSVWVSGLVIGFALVCQPHIMSKALYVKSDRDVRIYLAVTILISIVFSSLLLVGLFARVLDLPAEAMVDPATGLVRQDRVMAVYLAETFGPTMLAVVTVAVLAAGMSTLDGILVALSSIAANDLFLGIARPMLTKKSWTEDEQLKLAHRVSQGVLVALGLASLVIALDPPKLLGIFGQVGVYGIVAASTVPILVGITIPSADKRTAYAAAFAGLGVHFALYLTSVWAERAAFDLVAWAKGSAIASLVFDTSAVQLGWQNPAVTATYGLFVSLACAVPALIGQLLARRHAPARPSSEPAERVALG